MCSLCRLSLRIIGERHFRRSVLGQPDAGFAETILNACCRAPEGASRSVLESCLAASLADPQAREEKLKAILDILERDGCLIEQRPRYLFRFPLLREYWVRRVAPPLESAP